MTTPNPLAKTKGAGTTFWMYTGKGDAFANPLSDTNWFSCSTPVKSARFVSNIPTALLMFSVAG